MNPLHHSRYTRRGVTLVELMVVVTILMLLAAFAVPVMRPLTEGRRIREANRAIDVLLTQAKIRAVEIQRPVGVLFERVRQFDASGNPTVYQEDACNVLRLVEIPPPYAGEFTNSRVRVQNQGISSGKYTLHVQITLNDFMNGLIRPGDQIQFNYQGPYYTIEVGNPDFSRDANGYYEFYDPANTGSYAADTDNDTWVDTHWLTVTTPTSDVGGIPWPSSPGWSGGVPFQIFRQPQPSPVPPVRLPKDTVIDLGDSGYYDAADTYPTGEPRAFEIYDQTSTAPGQHQFTDAFARIGDTGTPALDYRGPMILFAPNGAIQFVYHWYSDAYGAAATYGPVRVTQPVFLMVGKWERTDSEPITSGYPVDIDSLADDGLHNWQDASNTWIAIGPQNGLVTGAQVHAPATSTTGISVPGNPDETDQANLVLQMQISRAYARESQISKGAISE